MQMYIQHSKTPYSYLCLALTKNIICFIYTVKNLGFALTSYCFLLWMRWEITALAR